MMEDDCVDNVIPIPNVMATILSKIIEWCKKHAQIKDDDSNNEKEKELRVADMIKGKDPKKIREIFNIKNDFKPEEEEQIREENSWAFKT
ncbi:hypothetical protein AAC387_Pa01g2715 [Persea americana]